MKSPNLLLFLSLLLLTGSVGAQQAPMFKPDDINIEYERFVLPNGLRLIVHEDHKAPIVAVNVWYHVGSKNEKPGKSGFAHLFEHLMFNGSEHFNDDYFQALERIGATDLNGTTNSDRTNYFQNVPLGALDQVLFLESDRMGHLLGVIDQPRLDEQRGVVQNEKRQGENQPYGRQYELTTKAMFPPGHPYSWTVIGEMEDLNAASLEDVQEWFKSYYGAANAVLVIAGDVNTQEIHQKVMKYFGHIPAGPTLARHEANVPVRTTDTRQSYQDRVPESRITVTWNTPELGNPENAHLDLAGMILGQGKNSRLYKALMYDQQLASQVTAYQYGREIAGNFTMQANVKPGNQLADVEKEMNRILWQFIEKGPTQEELNRVKASIMADFIKGMERIGGFGGKSDILAESEVYGGNPDAYKTYLKQLNDATIQDVHQAAKKWLSQGRHTLVAEPFPQYTTQEAQVDRTKGLPEMGQASTVKFPDLEEATLSNGMKIVLARREGVPTVDMRMLFDAGYAADHNAKSGTAALTMNLIDEGTKSKDALEISKQLEVLGASINSYSDLDASYVTMNTLKPTLDASLDLYADVLLNPAFPEKDFTRLKEQQITQIRREKSQPVQMALRVLPQFLYGENHPYSNPLTGSGYENTVSSITRDEVQKFYNDWLRPNNATLVVVGDITMDELKKKLETRFAKWQKADVPKKQVAQAPAVSGNTLYLLDRPESQQSIVIAGYLTEPYGKVSQITTETMNNILGGEFTSRINMNLREDKHWAYGAFTLLWDAKGQRPYIAYAPVQTDKTKESAMEIMKEFRMFAGENPATQEEFDKVQTNTVLGLPGRWETTGAVANSIAEIVKYDLDGNYYQQYEQNVRNLKLDDVHRLSKQMVKPDQLVWFVVGDREKIQPGLQELGFDKIVVVDADGKPVEETKVSKP